MPDLYACEEAWYCLRALPKKEHLAAVMLKKESGIEAFAPRIRYLKKTRRGKLPYVEPLFPGYVFVRSALKDTYRRVVATHGIRGVVAYGQVVPVIPNGFVEEIRARLSATDDALDAQEPPLRPGLSVTVTEGPFNDWQGIITGVIPARGRVKVLLELLGRQLDVELPAHALMAEQASPHQRVWRA